MRPDLGVIRAFHHCKRVHVLPASERARGENPDRDQRFQLVPQSRAKEPRVRDRQCLSRDLQATAHYKVRQHSHLEQSERVAHLNVKVVRESGEALPVDHEWIRGAIAPRRVAVHETQRAVET